MAVNTGVSLALISIFSWIPPRRFSELQLDFYKNFLTVLNGEIIKDASSVQGAATLRDTTSVKSEMSPP